MPRLLAVLVAILLTTLGLAQEKVTWSAKPADGSVAVTAKIKDGYYIYGLKPADGPVPTSIEAVPPLKASGPAIEPTPKRKLDANFGVEVDHHEKEAVFTLPVEGTPPANAKVKVRFQVCDNRTCEPPKTLEVPLSGAAATAVVAKPQDQSIWGFLVLAFGAGLLSLLTPCVFPMVPITVSYFTKQTGNGVAKAATFVLGIIGAFTVFGLAITLLFGASGIQTFAANPWVNLGMAAIFILLALSLWGVIHVGVPASISSKLEGKGRQGVLGPLFMGLAFTLTSFTCTSPLVGTILVSAASGDLLYPILGMIAFSSAFALPFFFLALFPQALSRLPRAGTWMETTKGFMGFLEVAAALKFLSNVDLVIGTNLISKNIFLVIWIVIFGLSALYLLGILKIKSAPVPPKIGPVRAGVIGLTVLTMGWLGTGIAGRSLGELEAFLPPGKTTWGTDYERAVAAAKAQNKPLFINFTGVTCTNCRWMEHHMFTRDDVGAILHNDFVKVELYTDRATAADEANAELQQKLTKSVTLPVYVVQQPDGTVTRIFPGSTRNAQEFLEFLKPTPKG